jgi:lysophospholipase L1-like esterase
MWGNVRLTESPAQPQSKRAADLAAAAGIVVLSIAISPVGIRFATGRLDLSPRVIVLSLTFDIFLLILAGAVLTRGRARRRFFHILMWSFLIAVVAGIEAGAVAIRLADRIAPLEDASILAHKNRWPAHLMSESRLVKQDGLTLYRPWQGDGIVINELGLRTALPKPKESGEWRIAVTGGSAAWGWRLLDADTIAMQLQRMLHGKGHLNMTVYNFGIEAVTVASELALLKRFRDLYDIDEVVFYTGANDATYRYMAEAVAKDGFGGLLQGASAFELIKTAHRLAAKLGDPSPMILTKFDTEVLPQLARSNSLRDGLVEADQYCRTTMMHCNFMLQPTLLRRKVPRGPEIEIARALEQVYPRYDGVIATMYRSALWTGLSVHDLSDLFDQSAEPFFVDVVHSNEAGNRLAAERIAAIIASVVH